LPRRRRIARCVPTEGSAIPDIFKMRLEMESAERRCAVVWRKTTRLGIEFR
jgi:hypothetical protein